MRSPRGQTVARARVARSAWSRLRGLIGRRLPEGEGLLFPSCTSVHTHFMWYAIDLVYLSDDDDDDLDDDDDDDDDVVVVVVVKVVHAIRPWRWSWGGRRARHVLELPAGTAARLAIERGDALSMRAPEDAGDAAPTAGLAETRDPR